MVSSFRGCLHTEADIASVIYAAYTSRVPQVSRRMSDIEKKKVRPGDVFVYQQSTSGILRWTDGWKWSPSRINSNFMVYKNEAMIKKCATGILNDEKYCVVVYTNNDECIGQCASRLLGISSAVRVQHHSKRSSPRREHAKPLSGYRKKCMVPFLFEHRGDSSDYFSSEDRDAPYRSDKFAEYMRHSAMQVGVHESDEMEGFRRSVFNDIYECETFF